MFIKIIYNK